MKADRSPEQRSHLTGNHPMSLELDLQIASDSTPIPTQADLRRWATAALADRRACAELTIRVVDEAESAELNLRYRGKPPPTNVLSFPFEPPPGLAATDLIGDLVICAPVVEREAVDQGKALEAHWAHMVIHGVLHLIGYDHVGNTEAAEMERLETVILCGLGFPQPYE
jgi:probable rRNA maturation factor